MLPQSFKIKQFSCISNLADGDLDRLLLERETFFTFRRFSTSTPPSVATWSFKEFSAVGAHTAPSLQ